MEDDEAVWRGMLSRHLNDAISSLMHPTQPLHQLTASVEHQIHHIQGNTCATCRRLPTECDVFSIAKLDCFKNSFRAEVPKERCGCVSDQALSSSQSSTEVEGALDILPVLLLGMVRQEEGGLALADLTGRVLCEVSASISTLNLIGRLVVLAQWNWIPSPKGEGYIEVEEMVCLPLSQDPPHMDHQLLSIARLKDLMSKKKLPSRTPLCVFGRVGALSETNRSYWLVELEDPLTSQITHPILNLVTHLLHLSSLLRLSEVYLFTDLKDKLLNKGSPDEQRVLVTTSSTQVHAHTSLEEPPLKKSKTCMDNSSPEGSQLLLNSLETSQLLEEPMSQSEGRAHGLVSYTGTITSCVLPEAGVYEMDGMIRLYLTHQTTPHHGRGLRVGSKVELHNVHILRVADKQLRHLSGLFSCSLSTVRVSQFSQLETPFMMYDSSNLLCCLVRRYRARDTAWLVDTFLTLRNRGLSAQRSFRLIQTLCTALTLPSLDKRDHLTEFLCHDVSCQLLTESTLTHPPVLAQIGGVLNEVSTMTNCDGFQWVQSSREDASLNDGGAILYTVATRWSYGVVKHSELQGEQLLVGELRGDTETGQIEFKDNTGHLLVSPCHSSTPQDYPLTNDAPTACVLDGFGANVLISEFDVVAEKTESMQRDEPNETRFFIIAKKMFVCKNSTKNSAKEADTTISEKTPSKLIIEIVNKNAVHEKIAAITPTLSFVALGNVYTMDPMSPVLHIALNFSRDVFNLHSFINNGCVYELTNSRDPLPVINSLVAIPAIEVTESMQLQFVRCVRIEGSLDVAEVVSQCFLPPIPTLINRGVKSVSSYCNKLVSVRGIVQSRGHRIDASSLPQTPSPPPPMLVFRLQSTSTPDSIMIYYKSPIIHTLPLGLVPGCEVTFYSFNMNISKSGNVYCTNSPSSSLSVHSVEGLDTIDSQRVYGISISMTRLPTILVHELTQCLLSGCLPRRVVCVRGCLLSTQKVCLTYKCRGCQCVIVNGQCMVACLQRRPFLVADGRLVIDDGSGEAHVYAEDDLLRQLLQVSMAEWNSVCDLVRRVGTVSYTKSFSATQHGGCSSRYDPSPLAQAEKILSAMATSPTLQQPIKLYARPFVSQGELGECVLGVKSRAIIVKEQRLNTLALPRLQLKAIACTLLQGTSCVSECKTLLKELSLDPQTL